VWGLHAGALAQLTLTLCGQNASHKVYWQWYCEDTRGSKIVRDIGTGIVPEVLLVVWQALLLPRVLYYLGQVRSNLVITQRHAATACAVILGLDTHRQQVAADAEQLCALMHLNCYAGAGADQSAARAVCCQLQCRKPTGPAHVAPALAHVDGALSLC